ncbi:MAG TPA: O-antigen ligase family protein [Croceicoccus sp.]|nr:O-antigen ligase family protein [Croceicoccus sp.]
MSPAGMLLTALLGAALIFGGGGRPAPLAGLVVQLATVMVVVLWLWLPSMRARAPSIWSWIVAGTVVAVPALQLVPLPPALWQALPGREIEVEILGIVQAADSWKPLSMAPSRTLASLLSLGPAVVMLLLASTLRPGEWRLPLSALATIVVLCAAVGALQLAAPAPSPLHFYGPNTAGWVTGFQANRNAQVDVLMIGMAAVAAIAALAEQGTNAKHPRHRRGSSLALAGSVIALLALAAVMTGSRAGLLVLPLVLSAIVLLLGHGRMSRGLLASMMGGIAIFAGVGIWAATSMQGGLARVAGRFQGFEDFRTELWTDTWVAIGQHWPWGGGMGLFQPLMIASERLEVVDPTVPVRAHNDYLELALEAGLPGLVAWAIVTGIVIVGLARRFRRRQPGEAATLAFAALTLTVIALHSLVDYPLRSMSLACLMALAAGFVLSAPRVPVRSPPIA